MNGFDDDGQLNELRRRLRRVRCAWLAVGVMSVRRYYLCLLIEPVALLVSLMCALTKMKAHHKLEGLTKDIAILGTRFKAYQLECHAISQSGEQLTSDRRQYLLATHSALMADRDRLLIAAEALKSPHSNVASAALHYVLTGLKVKASKLIRKNEAFVRIFSQVDSSPTYYWDLLLWFIIPGSHSEELVGDLTEEYQLRAATEGEAQAKSWYHEQVISTIIVHLPFWKNDRASHTLGFH